MNDGFAVMADLPDAFSDADRARFRELALAGDEVSDVVLATNILKAKALVMLRHDGHIRGIAALKRPQSSYRKDVAQKSGFGLPAQEYPYELGYVFVEPEVRRRGYAQQLISEALRHTGGMAIFATVRTDNPGMQKTLAKSGFDAKGRPYPGRRENQMIGLFVRAG